MISTNKKILQTKQSLRNALYSLIESNSIQDISVSQVCREANINRTTFYKYYSIPIDILSESIKEIFEQTLGQIVMKNKSTSENHVYNTMLTICSIYYENQQIMKIYMEHNKDLLPIMQHIIEKNLKNGVKENNLNCFISGGVAATIFQWSQNDYKNSPADIAKTLTQYILKLNFSSD